MPRVSLKDKLIEEFFTLDNNYEIDKIKAIQGKLNNYLGKHGEDSEISEVLSLSYMFESERESCGFKESQRLTKPILMRLINKKEYDVYSQCTKKWSFYDIRVLAITVGFARTYQEARDLTETALINLEDYKQEKRYPYVKLAIHVNMTARMLRGLYKLQEKDRNFEAEFNQAFENHVKEALLICDMDGQLKIVKTVVEIRASLFRGDYNAIDLQLDLLKKEEAEDVWKLAQDMVSEYNCHVGGLISQFQFRIMIGGNIKKLRILKGLSIEELAKRIKVTSFTIKRVEEGEKLLSLYGLYLLACNLDVPIDIFYQSLDTLSSERDIKKQSYIKLFNEVAMGLSESQLNAFLVEALASKKSSDMILV